MVCLAGAFFAAAFLTLGAGVSAAVLARRGRPAAAVVSNSLPFELVTVAGGSAAAFLAGVDFAFAASPFFGGIFAVLVGEFDSL